MYGKGVKTYATTQVLSLFIRKSLLSHPTYNPLMFHTNRLGLRDFPWDKLASQILPQTNISDIEKIKPTILLNVEVDNNRGKLVEGKAAQQPTQKNQSWLHAQGINDVNNYMEFPDYKKCPKKNKKKRQRRWSQQSG